MDIEPVIASMGQLIGGEACKWKSLHLSLTFVDWYDLSPFFAGLAANRSLEQFSFCLDYEDDWSDLQLAGMLGAGGHELLEKWLAGHPALYDVHFEMPLSEKEYRFLAEGAKRSTSLHKLSIIPEFDNMVAAFKHYGLSAPMLSLARSNPRIISLRWDPQADEIKRQLEANSRIANA
jgi:hypothetical protein